MRSMPPALIALAFLAACGKDESNARVANMTKQEADALNDAAAMIEARTEMIENVPNAIEVPDVSTANRAQDNPQKY